MSDDMSILSDETLHQICRVSKEDLDSMPALGEELRLARRLISASQVWLNGRLEHAITLLASAMGRLKQYNPTHLPFGYQGPTITSCGWIERNDLELITKQIVGLTWLNSTPDHVACAVGEAITKAVNLSLIEQKEYDAWRPGMASGSGWRAVVSATPYGVAKARTLTKKDGDAQPESAAQPKTADRGLTPGNNLATECLTNVQNQLAAELQSVAISDSCEEGGQFSQDENNSLQSILAVGEAIERAGGNVTPPIRELAESLASGVVGWYGAAETHAKDDSGEMPDKTMLELHHLTALENLLTTIAETDPGGIVQDRDIALLRSNVDALQKVLGRRHSSTDWLPREIASLLERGDFPRLVDDDFAKLDAWLTANARKVYHGLDQASLEKTQQVDAVKKRLQEIFVYNSRLRSTSAEQRDKPTGMFLPEWMKSVFGQICKLVLAYDGQTRFKEMVEAWLTEEEAHGWTWDNCLCYGPEPSTIQGKYSLLAALHDLCLEEQDLSIERLTQVEFSLFDPVDGCKEDWILCKPPYLCVPIPCDAKTEHSIGYILRDVENDLRTWRTSLPVAQQRTKQPSEPAVAPPKANSPGQAKAGDGATRKDMRATPPYFLIARFPLSPAFGHEDQGWVFYQTDSQVVAKELVRLFTNTATPCLVVPDDNIGPPPLYEMRNGADLNLVQRVLYRQGVENVRNDIGRGQWGIQLGPGVGMDRRRVFLMRCHEQAQKWEPLIRDELDVASGKGKGIYLWWTWGAAHPDEPTADLNERTYFYRVATVDVAAILCRAFGREQGDEIRFGYTVGEALDIDETVLANDSIAKYRRREFLGEDKDFFWSAWHWETHLPALGGSAPSAGESTGGHAESEAGDGSGWDAAADGGGWVFEDLPDGEVRARNRRLCERYAALNLEDLLLLCHQWRQMATRFTEATKKAGKYHGHVVHDEKVQEVTKILETAMVSRQMDGASRLSRCLRRPDDDHLHHAIATLDVLEAKLRAETCKSGELNPGDERLVSPAVQLGCPGEPCLVFGQKKRPLTDAQLAVVDALIKAGAEGLTKDGLEAVRSSARRILKTLRKDKDWAKVIFMPGQTNGRYRIKT